MACQGAWGSAENSPHSASRRSRVRALAPHVVVSRAHLRRGAEQEVSVDRGGEEVRQIQKPRQVAGVRIKQNKSKKIKAISDSLGSVTTWFFLDFVLFNWIRFSSEAICEKMVISPQFRRHWLGMNRNRRPRSCSKMAVGKSSDLLRV